MTLVFPPHASSVALALVLMLACTGATRAAPQVPLLPDTPADAGEAADLAADPGLRIEAIEAQAEEIIVTATYQRGSVPGDIKPETQLGSDDIRSFGASSLADLLQELGPQLRSGRGRGGGRPVVLLNGRRVSGFSEIRNLPPEALERVDILPEEVSLKYGFRADQRVVNFVLRERFSATTVELEPGLATDGGRGSLEGEANLLRLVDGSRFSLEGEYRRDGMLLESERRIITPPPSLPYSLEGNLAGPRLPGGGFGELDPALSALAGQLVTLVPVSGAPTLAGLAVGTVNVPGTTDLTPFRSLLPRSETFSLGATYNREIGTVSATLSGRFEGSDTEARLGLAGVSLGIAPENPFSPFAGPATLYRHAEAPGPLLRRQDSRNASLGLGLNWDAGVWRWSFNANYDRAVTNTLVDRSLDVSALQARLDANDPAFNPFAAGAIAGPLRQDSARASSDLARFELVSSGSPFSLPAGAVVSTFQAGFETLRQRALANRGGIGQDVRLGRDQGRVQASLDLPVTSARNNVLAAVGDLSLNLNASLDQLSDFGTLSSIGYGLNWAPTQRLRLLVSVTDEEAAPSIQQLGNPLIVTPNVRVFDLVRGEAVDITRLDGGNAALTADSRRVIKLGGTWQPFGSDLSLSVNFVDSRLKGQVEAFPAPTPEIEAAFPDRFLRDGQGRLLQIDNRPVNFAGADRQELRTGLSLFRALKPSARERAEAERRRQAMAERRRQAGEEGAAAAPSPPSMPPMGGRGGRGMGSGRIFVSAFHTLHTVNRIRIRDGVAPLDLLRGSAIGTQGGQPRHEVELRLGANKGGFGGRLGLDWRAGTVVKADPANPLPGAGDLVFSDLATMNLRLFADLGSQQALVRKVPFLRGSRLSLNIDNLTNARLQVRNRLGEVPLGYQPDQIDPLGRTVRLQFRKIFSARPPASRGR